MAAWTNAMVNSPQFSKVLEQMNVVEAQVNKEMKKTANLRNSTPLIQVTCFDDETYNENMLKQLENPTWSVAEETSTAQSEENYADKQSTQGESVCSGYTSNNDREEAYNKTPTSYGGENAVLESNRQARKKSQSSSKGFAVSSQAPNRKITSTKIENNDVETKKENLNKVAADQLNTSVTRTARRPSLSSSDSQRSDVITSPSLQRQRYTVCSISGENYNCKEPQNNSEHSSQRTTYAQGRFIQNIRSVAVDKKHSSEIMKSRKKSERIDLSFKTDATTKSAHSNHQAKKRTQGLSQIEKNSGHASSDEVFRTFDDDCRSDNESSAVVGSPPKSPTETFQSKAPMKSRKFSENSLSILKDAINIDNRSAGRRPSPVRRISTSMIEGANSSSLGIKESSRSRSEADAEMTKRLNLATPPRTCKHSATPKPPPDEKPAQLGVRKKRFLSKSETDLRKIVSEEGEAKVRRGFRVSNAPRANKFSSSLGVGGSLSLSKSETELHKLVSEEEKTEKRKNSLLCQSPRMRRGSAGSSPLSPREERKIYLAASKAAPRLPIRAKSRNDLQASSQAIIDYAEKELDKFNDRLPHISMEQVMKSWQTDRRHWNMVSIVVKPNGEGNVSKTNMEAVKDCRYIRESVVTTKRKKHSN